MNKRDQLTAEILAKYRCLNNEFYMLKGLLCMSHVSDVKEAIRLGKVFNVNMIANRMDEIRSGS